MCHIFPLLLFTLLIGLVLSCGYIPPKPGEVQHAFIESGHSIHKREADHNLRIKYFYDEESLKRITIDKFRIINVCSGLLKLFQFIFIKYIYLNRIPFYQKQ